MEQNDAVQNEQSLEGAEILSGEEQSTEHTEGGDTDVEQQAESEVETPEEQSTESEALPEKQEVKKAMGIGQFVRYMMLNSEKSNTEILELVKKLFPEGRTTPACIAWYKTDLRNKGLMPKNNVRSTKSVALSPEELAELVK